MYCSKCGEQLEECGLCDAMLCPECDDHECDDHECDSPETTADQE